MSMIINVGGGQKRLLVKGASEMVLKSCNQFHNKDTNKVVPLDESVK
jgi:hypothetical protein